MKSKISLCAYEVTLQITINQVENVQDDETWKCLVRSPIGAHRTVLTGFIGDPLHANMSRQTEARGLLSARDALIFRVRL